MGTFLPRGFSTIFDLAAPRGVFPTVVHGGIGGRRRRRRGSKGARIRCCGGGGGGFTPRARGFRAVRVSQSIVGVRRVPSLCSSSSVRRSSQSSYSRKTHFRVEQTNTRTHVFVKNNNYNRKNSKQFPTRFFDFSRTQSGPRVCGVCKQCAGGCLFSRCVLRARRRGERKRINKNNVFKSPVPIDVTSTFNLR